jgi:hypothetical protein
MKATSMQTIHHLVVQVTFPGSSALPVLGVAQALVEHNVVVFVLPLMEVGTGPTENVGLSIRIERGGVLQLYAYLDGDHGNAVHVVMRLERLAHETLITALADGAHLVLAAGTSNTVVLLGVLSPRMRARLLAYRAGAVTSGARA